MLKCDLHLHTNRSDGSLSPVSLMDCLKVSGLEVVAVTDHDTVDGVSEILGKTADYPFKFLTGIEFSTFDKDEIHILGYNYDIKNTDLIDFIGSIKLIRKKRNEVIINKLKSLGINIPFYDVCKDENKQYGRKIIAQLMTDEGYVTSIDQAFEIYLGQEKLAYAPYNHATPREAIETINKAHGISVFAHPYRSCENEDIDEIVRKLVELGLNGIEVYYPSHTKNEIQHLLELCRRYNLIATGGSDFHNPNDPEVHIGSGNGVLDDEAAKALGIITV